MTYSPGNSAGDLSAFAGAWTLDPAQSSVSLRTKALWLLPVHATLRALEGHGTVGSGGEITGSLVIDAGSINTKIAKRDKHLRSADFLDTARYPTITFTARTARLRSADTAEVAGELTIVGRTNPLTVNVEVVRSAHQLRLRSHVEINRDDWGISTNDKGASLKNHLSIIATFVRNRSS